MNLFWDRQNRKMKAGLTSTEDVTDPLVMVLRDFYPVQLLIVEPQAIVGASFAVVPIQSGRAIRFQAKLASDLAGAALVDVPTWTETGPGAAVYYTADMPFDNASLIAAVELAGFLDLLAEFTFERTDGKHELSTQFNIRVLLDVYRGTEP